MKYGIMGYSGRMGKLIQEVFTQRGHELVYRCDLQEEIQQDVPQVIIDFSTPRAFSRLMEKAREFNCSLVVGTTALKVDDLDILKDYAKNRSVVYARNFSKGIVMLKNMLKGLSGEIHDWDIEIIEKHHRYKKDKPSGTAKMLAECFDFEVPTSSIRMGGIPGEHTILIAGLGEIIEIKHQAISPRTFAEGACFSAEKIFNVDKGFFTFDQLCAGEALTGEGEE
ncbi:MAG TPA: dihydrodipicolinate reductase C-terminal domain-containing protein [Thermotogota bacterium]|nr:dihydrodipicolinate reductase C-terminal domain-containing protein [Thermotogota bacterium]